MLKLKNILLFFAVSAVVGSLARSFCLIYTTEPSTGFLLHRMKGLGIALMAFIAVITLCLFVFSMFLKERPLFKEVPSLNCAVSSIILAAAIIIDMVRGLFIEHSMLWQFAAKEIFGILSAITFFLYGLKKFIKVPFNPTFFSIPVVFIIFQTIEVFTSYATLAIITEHLFDLSVLCFLLIFFLYFAKNAAGIKGKYKNMLIPTGFCASLLCITSFISRSVTVLVGCESHLHGKNPLSVSLFFFGIFILIWILESKEITE